MCLFDADLQFVQMWMTGCIVEVDCLLEQLCMISISICHCPGTRFLIDVWRLFSFRLFWNLIHYWCLTNCTWWSLSICRIGSSSMFDELRKVVIFISSVFVFLVFISCEGSSFTVICRTSGLIFKIRLIGSPVLRLTVRSDSSRYSTTSSRHWFLIRMIEIIFHMSSLTSSSTFVHTRVRVERLDSLLCFVGLILIDRNRVRMLMIGYALLNSRTLLSLT